MNKSNYFGMVPVSRFVPVLSRLKFGKKINDINGVPVSRCPGKNTLRNSIP